jgi:hypothetical protein
MYTKQYHFQYVMEYCLKQQRIVVLFNKQKNKQTPWPLVRERTIPTDDRHLLTKFSANFCG